MKNIYILISIIVLSILNSSFIYSQDNSLKEPIFINFENNDIDFKIFPNPSTEYLNISTNLDHFTIEIRNIIGKQEIQIKNSKKVLVSGLKPGMYIIEIYANNQIRLSKTFIKN